MSEAFQRYHGLASVHVHRESRKSYLLEPHLD